VRLAALFGITVTGMVYSTVLAKVHEPQGWQETSTNNVFHYIVPIMMVLAGFCSVPAGESSLERSRGPSCGQLPGPSTCSSMAPSPSGTRTRGTGIDDGPSRYLQHASGGRTVS
jgi:hypothetical protein